MRAARGVRGARPTFGRTPAQLATAARAHGRCAARRSSELRAPPPPPSQLASPYSAPTLPPATPGCLWHPRLRSTRHSDGDGSPLLTQLGWARVEPEAPVQPGLGVGVDSWGRGQRRGRERCVSSLPLPSRCFQMDPQPAVSSRGDVLVCATETSNPKPSRGLNRIGSPSLS